MSNEDERGCWWTILFFALYFIIGGAGILCLEVFSVLPRARYGFVIMLYLTPPIFFIIANGIRTGKLRTKQGRILERAVEPKTFWAAIAIYMVSYLALTITGIAGILGHLDRRT